MNVNVQVITDVNLIFSIGEKCKLLWSFLLSASAYFVKIMSFFFFLFLCSSAEALDSCCSVSWFSFLCLLLIIDSCCCLFQDWTLLQHTSIGSIRVTYSRISSYFTKRFMLSSFLFLLSQVLYLNTRSNDLNYLSKHKFYFKLFLPSQVL